MPLFCVAFGTTLAELTWWTTFNLRNVAQQSQVQARALERDATLARDFLRLALRDSDARGEPRPAALARLHAQLQPLFFDLDFGDDGQVVPRPAVLLANERAARGYLRMFLAEGSFFFLMMVVGAGLIVRALRHEINLVRQGKNFLAAVTHELKSPLASMRLWLETLQRRPLAADAQQRTYGILLRDVDRLERLVGNVLAAARLDAEQDAPARLARAHKAQQAPPIELGEATRAAMEGLRPYAEAKGVALLLHRGAPTWALVDADAWALVVRNLVDNAIKFSGQGSKVDIEVVARDTATAALVVHDVGTGIAATEQHRIFDKFYRVGNEMVRASEGTGLGLYLVRGVLAAWGGRVTAASAGLGQGATFTVLLPRAHPAACVVPKASQPRQAAPP